MIRGIMSCCHLLEEGDASVLIDTGLAGEPILIQRLLRKLGLKPNSIQAISITRGIWRG
jgi:glyoxylase-like metal-dependent hydrolase (beta-lactamase superfamily II)